MFKVIIMVTQRARIKLSSAHIDRLEDVCNELKNIAKRFGIAIKGPIPLPTKKLRVTTMKTPCGDGTGHGNATYDRFEMRIHKRMIDISADERALRQIMRVSVPDGVHISIKLKG